MKKLCVALVIVRLCLASHTLVCQDANPQLLQQVVKSGAFVESLTGYCTQKNARGAQTYQSQLAAWKQRNLWEAILPKAAPGEYEAATANAKRILASQGLRAIVLCLNIQQALESPTFDPSRQHAQELAQIAQGNGSAAPPVASSGPNVETAPPAAHATPVPGPSAPSTPAPAQPQPQTNLQPSGTVQVGDASFLAPAGWLAGKNTNNEALYEKRVGNSDFQILAFEQRPMQGDLKSAFAAVVRGSFPGKPPVLKYMYSAETRTGLPAMYVRDGSQLQNGKSVAIRAVGVGLPNSQIFVVLLISTDSFGNLNAAEKSLTSVVSSLRFQSQGNADPWDPLTEKDSKGNARGLYWYSTVIPMANVLGGMDVRAIRKYIILLPDGHAYRDLPEDGHVLDINFQVACSEHPENCGSYTIEGPTIHFQWPADFGLTEKSSGKYMPGKSLVSQSNEYAYVPPVKDLRISGRYSSFFAVVGNNASGSTSVSSEKYITFTPDGRYQRQGFSGASFSNQNAMGTVGGPRRSDIGTYQLDGYTLILTPQTTGKPEVYTVVVENPSAHPDALFINDDGYLSK